MWYSGRGWGTGLTIELIGKLVRGKLLSDCVRRFLVGGPLGSSSFEDS